MSFSTKSLVLLLVFTGLKLNLVYGPNPKPLSKAEKHVAMMLVADLDLNTLVMAFRNYKISMDYTLNKLLQQFIKKLGNTTPFDYVGNVLAPGLALDPTVKAKGQFMEAAHTTLEEMYDKWKAKNFMAQRSPIDDGSSVEQVLQDCVEKAFDGFAVERIKNNTEGKKPGQKWPVPVVLPVPVPVPVVAV